MSIITTEAGSISDMQVDQANLYWVEGSASIMKMPLGGGAPSAIVSAPAVGGEQIHHMAIDGPKVYWTESTTMGSAMGGVYARAIDGSGSSMPLTTVKAPLGISVDGGYVYFTAASSEIDRVATSGGPMTTLVRGIDANTAIVATGGFVYLVIQGAGSIDNIFRVPGDASAGPAGGQKIDAGAGSDGGMGGALSQVSMNGSISTLILSSHADEGSIYWAVFDQLFKYAGNGAQVGLGQVSNPLTPDIGGSVNALYPYKGNVYWMSIGFAGPTGDLWKFSPGGDVRQHLASGRIGAFAVSDTSVYFADGRTIRRVDH